jgi:hypothetical protein
MENKTPEQKAMEKEALEIAGGLHGKERIKAYNLAGRTDLALNYANELLIGQGFNYGRGPQTFSPYTKENWEVLRQKKEFDDEGIHYNPEAVKKGLLGTYIGIYLENPSQSDIDRIDGILAKNNANLEERTNFFVALREEAKKRASEEDHSRFVFGGKETPYAALASHTGIPRKEVALFHLRGVFTPDKIRSVMCNRDHWAEELGALIRREKIEGEEVLKLAEKVANEYKPCWFSSTYNLDKARYRYELFNGISEAGISLPRKTTIKLLREYVKAGAELFEEYYPDKKYLDPLYRTMKDDPEVKALRELSLRHEIERGPLCVFERIEYGIKTFGLNPKAGWLGKSLETHLKRWRKGSEEWKIGSALYAGEKYGLLPKEEVASLKRRLELIKSIKKGTGAEKF